MIKKRKHRIHFMRATGTYNLLTQCFPLIALNPFTDLLRFSIPKIHFDFLLFQITGDVIMHRLCTFFSTCRKSEVRSQMSPFFESLSLIEVFRLPASGFRPQANYAYFHTEAENPAKHYGKAGSPIADRRSFCRLPVQYHP